MSGGRALYPYSCWFVMVDNGRLTMRWSALRCAKALNAALETTGDGVRRYILSLLLLPLSVSAVALDRVAMAEIEHLLSYLKSSGCQFNRNGSWYDAEAAAAHLKKKYEYLLEDDELESADSFVVKAASESSMSGKPYLVSCRGGTEQASGSWFASELERYRAETKVGK